MKHADYLALARNLLNHQPLGLDTQTRVDILFNHFKTWSHTQCINLVDELEGRRTYERKRREPTVADQFLSTLK